MTPTITVITPSYNQATFIEKTIRSVIEQQGDFRLEYFIFDGGSRDGSVEIIRRYERHLAGWGSEPDGGQSAAINKGLQRGRGDILCWLNSDDYFAPGTLAVVAETLGRGDVKALAGHCVLVASDGGESFQKGHYQGRLRLLSRHGAYRMHQPSIFWRREVTERVGLLDESMHLIMDYDYWCRISRHYDFLNVDRVLSYCHRHAATKTHDDFVGYHRARHDYLQQVRAELTTAERFGVDLMDAGYLARDRLHRYRRRCRDVIRGWL